MATTSMTILSVGPRAMLLSLPLLVISEHKSRFYGGVVLFKMLSSASFLIGPLTLMAKTPAGERSPYTLAITVGLLCSMVGDFCLLPSRSEFHRENAASSTSQDGGVSASFQAGVVAFAAAHIAYIVAFLSTAQSISNSALLTTFFATLLMAKWLGVIYPPPASSARSNVLELTLPPEMKPLVLIYAIIISSMFAVAIAVSDSAPASSGASFVSQRVLGAAMFVVSDIFVAANAFGRGRTGPGSVDERGIVRIALGYGLYFWGQMAIAGTVEGPY
ncbi:YhhN-like protein [Aspergillus keveii]|uniref:YhhN-like protein n=1 Tax=Aspergillus keveii TaxID=714993 RepID=A0ABR4FII5_9EURO